MACCPSPWRGTGQKLAGLRCSDPSHVMAALGVLNGSGRVQEKKDELVERILREPDREGCVSALRELLCSADSRLCSIAVYLLGALVEKQDWVKETLEATQGDVDGLVGALGRLLTSDNPDIVMNAAGAIASLVGSGPGREWLLRDRAVFGEVLGSLSALLDQDRESTVNYAALILARLSLCEAACQALLRHSSANDTLRSLARCLAHSHTDTAMNAAFALGRLCGNEEGRRIILALEQEHRLVSSLQALLCEGAGPGAGQTACFALSCLATEEDGHALVLGSSAFPSVMEGLLRCLQEEDHDSVWFAAMTVKVLVSQPSGVLQVREHTLLEERLQSLSCSNSIGQELQEEVDTCLRKLQRLTKPLPPTTRLLPSGSYMVSWEKCVPESGLEVTYSLLDRNQVLYSGTQCHLTLPSSALQSRRTLSLCLVQSTTGGDVSPCSDPTLLAVESKEAGSVPGPPQQLCVIGCTPTQVRLSWAAPEGGVKPRMYQLYRGDRLLDTTTEPGAIVGGLSPGTLYRLGVCAVGPGGVAGGQAEVEARTSECQDHAPTGLTLTVLGRHELLVSWGAPALPLGRLFNYELRLNGRVAYLGTERAHTARRLSANTPYTCTVTAITSRGRCQSRPVTKRTARDEYMHTQRCLYSPSRQAPPQTPAPPPPAREVTEVRERVRKAGSPHGRLPKVHLSVQSDREAGSGRDRNRRYSVSAQLPGCESSKPSSHTCEVSPTEQQQQAAVGTVSGCDIKALWRSSRESAEGGVGLKSAQLRPLLPRRAGTEGTLLLRRTSLSLPQTPSCRPTGAKASMGTLLQYIAPGAASSERAGLPSISHRVPGLVRYIQPISHVWPDLECPSVDWTGHYPSRVPGDRPKLLRPPRVRSEFRQRRSMTTN
ncbi:hypothetical protein MATL_G00083090 [Megalops atlanticus]|uniref:Fibronectin type-III domain-containing protein n=1 Tax=Megalops atlanticus TaxID=7932 RepID=A0A9D3T7W9_MEGAT|nr:hypothetical protein MATL_G00083090 [Megalops atlanticus]